MSGGICVSSPPKSSDISTKAKPGSTGNGASQVQMMPKREVWQMDKLKPGGYLTVTQSDTGTPDKKKPGQRGERAGLSSSEKNNPSPQCTKPGLLSQFGMDQDRICSECKYTPSSDEYYIDGSRLCYGCHGNHIQIQWHEWDMENTRPVRVAHQTPPDAPRCDNAVMVTPGPGYNREVTR